MKVTVTVESSLGDVEVTREREIHNYTLTEHGESYRQVRGLIEATAKQAMLAYPGGRSMSREKQIAALKEQIELVDFRIRGLLDDRDDLTASLTRMEACDS